MSEQSQPRRGYRSLFWPVILITVGVIILLGNLGVLTAANIVSVVRMWPLLLILIGLDLLFGRSSPLLGALIGVGAVVVIIIIMLVGPSIGLAGNWEVREFTRAEPLDGAESARVTLDGSLGHLTVAAADSRENLIEADLRYVGSDIEFEASGESEKVVRLGQRDNQVNLDFGGFVGWFINPQEQLRWEIGLNPDVPLELSINGGVGESDLDLRDLNLTALNLSGGVGEMKLTLPATGARYEVRLNGSVGGLDIEIPDRDADLVLWISGGVGGINIDVPDDAAVRVRSTGGLGGVNVPDGFERISGGDDFGSDQGVWETPGFERAERQIVIEFSGGVGGLTVR